MTREEKRKKAVATAVAYFIEDEKAKLRANRANKVKSSWMQAGRIMQMNLKRMIQQRGSFSSSSTLFGNKEPFVLN